MPSPDPAQAGTKDDRDLFANGPYPTARAGKLVVVEHRELGRTFVANVLQNEFCDEPSLMDWFYLEAQALGRLEHPHIVSVSNFGTTVDWRPYIILEVCRRPAVGGVEGARPICRFASRPRVRSSLPPRRPRGSRDAGN